MLRAERCYKPGRRAHRVLQRIADEACGIADLRSVAGRSASAAKKLPYLLRALVEDGLLSRELGGVYRLTSRGARTLGWLNDERPAVGKPSVRIFAAKEPT